MRRIWMIAAALAAAFAAAAPIAHAQTQTNEARVAFVVGNANYSKGPLKNSLNDAGLVAEALRSIGFDIVEGADVSQQDFVRTYRDFLAKVAGGGPDTIAVVYFSGYGLEYEGENFLVTADAQLARDSDIPLEAVRLSDLLRPLADTPARARVVMLDVAHPLPFLDGRPLARGLAAIEAPAGTLVSFSAGPSMIVDEGAGPYGPFATAVAEMIRAPGVDLDAAFVEIRSRTHQLTEGAQTPWHVSALGGPVVLVPATPEAVAATPPPPPPRQQRPLQGIDPDEAYALAIESDQLPTYVEFVEAYPRHPYAARIWVIIRARREALAWERALQLNTPQAYWTYARRYPRGLYAYDAELRLRRLSAALEPPPGFVPVDFVGVPMALAGEPVEYVRIYPHAPPPPLLLIRPPHPQFVNLAPPSRPLKPGFLPVFKPLPVLIKPNPTLIRPVRLDPSLGKPKLPVAPNVKPVVTLPGKLQPVVTPQNGKPVVNLQQQKRVGTQGVINTPNAGPQFQQQQKKNFKKPVVSNQQPVVVQPVKPVVVAPQKPVIQAAPKIQQPQKPVVVQQQPVTRSNAAAAPKCPPGKSFKVVNGQAGCH